MPFKNNFKQNHINALKMIDNKRGAESDEESERDKKPSKSFKSDKASKPKLDEYDVVKQGLVLIFNQENFPDVRKKRVGTGEDVDALEKSFSDRHHFKVICEQDLSKESVQEEIARVATHKKYKDYSYIIIVFLSHGDAQGIIELSCGNYITNEEIWQPFCSEESIWRNKPKLFIFQACKGGEFTAVDIDNVNQPNKEVCTDMGKKHKMVPKEADILVAYCTVEGNVSMRDKSAGTWYIQKLCEMITEYGKCEDILDILTRVN